MLLEGTSAWPMPWRHPILSLRKSRYLLVAFMARPPQIFRAAGAGGRTDPHTDLQQLQLLRAMMFQRQRDSYSPAAPFLQSSVKPPPLQTILGIDQANVAAGGYAYPLMQAMRRNLSSLLVASSRPPTVNSTGARQLQPLMQTMGGKPNPSMVIPSPSTVDTAIKEPAAKKPPRRANKTAPRRLKGAPKHKDEIKWLASYQELKEYKQRHGNCSVHQGYMENPKVLHLLVILGHRLARIFCSHFLPLFYTSLQGGLHNKENSTSC